VGMGYRWYGRLTCMTMGEYGVRSFGWFPGLLMKCGTTGMSLGVD